MKKWLYFKSNDLVSRRGIDFKPFHSPDGETDWEQRYRNKVGSMDEAAWEFQKQAKADVLAAVEPWLRERFPDPGEVRILELACGFAGVGLELLARGYDVHVSDYSPSLVQELLVPRLKALGHDPSRAFVADVMDLSGIASGRNGGAGYDVVLSSGLYGFQDMGRMDVAYREVHSLLRPGGLFVHWADSYRNGYVDMVTTSPFRQVVNGWYAVIGCWQGALQLLKANPKVRRLLGRSPIPPLCVDSMFYGWLLTEEQMKGLLAGAGFEVLNASHLCAGQGQVSRGQTLSWLGGLWNRLKIHDEMKMWGQRLFLVVQARAKNEATHGVR
ncbi:class I SAM-dependent methyltransferase [Desulfocurvus sp. DL9XJH121]